MAEKDRYPGLTEILKQLIKQGEDGRTIIQSCRTTIQEHYIAASCAQHSIRGVLTKDHMNLISGYAELLGDSVYVRPDDNDGQCLLFCRGISESEFTNGLDIFTSPGWQWVYVDNCDSTGGSIDMYRLESQYVMKCWSDYTLPETRRFWKEWLHSYHLTYQFDEKIHQLTVSTTDDWQRVRESDHDLEDQVLPMLIDVERLVWIRDSSKCNDDQEVYSLKSCEK